MSERSLLILSRYGFRGASSRLRMLQYIDSLRDAGFRTKVCEFFDDAYLDSLYRGDPRDVGAIIQAFARRFVALLSVRRFDLVWIEKELLPFLPGFFESWVSRAGVPYVVDYDDATFHTYDRHRSSLVRRVLGGKLDPLLRGAACVVVGNSYLGEYAELHGARRVVMVPTVVDIERYPVDDAPAGSELRLGWIGSPATAKYLEFVFPILAAANSEFPVRLVTIGAPALSRSDFPLEQHSWAEATEATLLGDIDVGIMPLPDDDWERGKCGYKLIQYMACARPVIASPVGVNRDIVTDDVGFLASDSSQWLSALRELAADKMLRVNMGLRARRKAETAYSLQAVAPRIVGVMREVVCAG